MIFQNFTFSTISKKKILLTRGRNSCFFNGLVSQSLSIATKETWYHCDDAHVLYQFHLQNAKPNWDRSYLLLHSAPRTFSTRSRTIINITLSLLNISSRSFCNTFLLLRINGQIRTWDLNVNSCISMIPREFHSIDCAIFTDDPSVGDFNSNAISSV